MNDKLSLELLLSINLFNFVFAIGSTTKAVSNVEFIAQYESIFKKYLAKNN